MSTYTGKVWFITGASSGLGHSIALAALAIGDTVICTARDPSKVSTLTALGAHALALDITKPDSIPSVVEAAWSIHNRIDIFLNCIGVLLEGALEELTVGEFENTVNVNVTSMFHLCQALLPKLRVQRSGTIAALGSIAGWYSGTGWSAYSCVKFALVGMLMGLKEEVKGFGIDVVCVEPGYFRTNFLGSRVVAERRLEEYESVMEPVRGFFSNRAGKQRGDPEKGARIVVEILGGRGRAEGRALPERLLLGADAVEVGWSVLEKEKKVLGEWEEIVKVTDHELQFE